MIYRSKYPLAFALILAAGLAGCIKEREVVPAGGKARPVVFSPQVSRGGESRALNNQPDGTRTLTGTRALPGHPVENIPGTPDAALIPDGKSFGVYAWVKETAVATATNFAGLQNMKVTRSGSEYTYTPTADWPRDNDARLSFFAYYPHSGSADADESIAVSHGTGADQWMRVAYTVSGDAGEHIDLMYAKTDMTLGYDPVNLNFGHALARLKFEGRTEGYPVGAMLKITGIKIKGATLEGELVVLDPTTQPGKPFWELSDAPADKGDMTIPAAHIENVALTQTLQPVISTDGDMLVLPQSLGGMTVEVSASLNGTAFPQPFVFALEGTPNWTMNEITTYEITLTPDGMRVAARVADWAPTDPVNVVYDGQYYMELSRDRLDLYKEGGTLTLEIKTDYDKINAATGAAGSYLDVSGVESWATVTDLGQTVSGGEYTRKVKIEAAALAGTTDQTPGKIIVKAGNLNYVFHLTQSKDSWLITSYLQYYVMDGEAKSVTVTAAADWMGTIISGNEPVNGKYPITNFLTSTGTSGTSYLKFVPYDALATHDISIGNHDVSIRFTDLSGVNNSTDITVRLFTYPDGGLAERITWGYIPELGKDGYIITYDPRDAGLLFKFGSVVGVYSDNGKNKDMTPPLYQFADTFDPGDLPWNLTNISASGSGGWEIVPYNSTPLMVINTDFHNTTNVKEGKGDPCRLVGMDLDKIKDTPVGSLKSADIDNGKWRLPIKSDNEAFCYGYSAGTYWWDENQIGSISNGVRGAELPMRNGAYGIYKFLPSIYHRNYTDGSMALTPQLRYYTALPGTVNTLSGITMIISGSSVYPNYDGTGHMAYAFGIRCVRQ